MTIDAFRHGVASGDPMHDRVLLWTRVTAAGDGDVAVHWCVANDPGLVSVRSQGTAIASPARDWTVHVDVDGLVADSTYYFGFTAGGTRSPIGRTRTTPAGGSGRVRLGVVSCASWPAGFFNAYSRLSAGDVDLVVHLGDYLYEQGGQAREVVRAHEPTAAPRALADYRRRHAQYKTDPDLQRLHARHPVVAVWDDHEIVGDAWRGGAGAHDPAADGDWRGRRDAAVQAYLEWMPVRAGTGAEIPRIYRTLRLGDLVDLVMLDTRLVGRDQPAPARPTAGLQRRDRSLLGDEQRRWLRETLKSSRARWRLIGSQVMLAPLHGLRLPGLLMPLGRRLGAVGGGAIVNPGQWDGYPDERRQLLEFLHDERVGNVVVLSGDVHSSWAAELRPDGSRDPVAVELVTPSVTSASFVDTVLPRLPRAAPLLASLLRLQNPHVRFADTAGHGYVVVDVTPERVAADWWHVDTITRRTTRERRAASLQVRDGDARPRPVAPPARR